MENKSIENKYYYRFKREQNIFFVLLFEKERPYIEVMDREDNILTISELKSEDMTIDTVIKEITGY